MKYEHQLTFCGSRRAEQTIDKWCNEGWELVSHTFSSENQSEYKYSFVFRRLLVSEDITG